MKISGVVVKWNSERGFGFISPSDGGKQHFFHVSDVASKGAKPAVGKDVTYELGQDADGRLRGQSVKFAGMSGRTSKLTWAGVFWYGLVILFTAVLVKTYQLNYLPVDIAWFYAVMSVITFVLYAWDKRSAIKGRWRTQESTLHIFALLGGWPGAIFGQQLLRHKSKKAEFRVIFWLTFFANLAAFAYLFTASGRQLMWQWLPVIRSLMDV